MRFFFWSGVSEGGVSGASRGNSAVFWVTDSIFCMEVRMDCPDKLWDFFWSGASVGGSQGRQGITQTCFELQTPYFAWNFVWTVTKNYEIFFVRGVKRGISGAVRGNSAIFWATESRFCMVVRMKCHNKIWKKYGQGCQKGGGVSGASRGISAIFWATDSKFSMELHMNCLNKLYNFFC